MRKGGKVERWCVDQASNGGYTRTPLYIAAQEGHEAVVELLIAAKADVNKADKYGKTPLWSAAYNGEEACFSNVLITNN
jgi:ankyrin repeat protein